MPIQETQETWVWSLGWEDALEEEMATCSSILVWEVPQREEPGGLQSMGSQRAGWDLVTENTQANQARVGFLAFSGKSQNTEESWLAVFSFWNKENKNFQPDLFRIVCVCAKSLQSWLTLCDPMDCSPPGSSLHRISQARILEWVATAPSTKSNLRLLHLRQLQVDSYVLYKMLLLLPPVPVKYKWPWSSGI